MKGISPVIATILMVMITVGLVAFSYSWFMGMGQTAQTSTETQLAGMKKAAQVLLIPAATYRSADRCVYFELTAAATNEYAIPNNTLTYYINDWPVSVDTWDGGVGGTSCISKESIGPGDRCYGMINLSTNSKITVCNVSAAKIDIFKVSSTWGTEPTRKILCQ